MAEEQEIKVNMVHVEDDPQNAPGDEIDNKIGSSSTAEGRASSREVKKQEGKKKWGLLILVITAAAVIGTGFVFFSGTLDINNRYKFIPLTNKEDISLSEEMLSPFFIPPSEKTSMNVIRVDVSVIWNGLASIRFEKKELQIRDNVYRIIKDSAEQTDDLNNRISYLEEEMGKIFQESLNVRDLAIKIKEIKYF